MKCTGKEWDTCRVEKMGCCGCYYDEKKFIEFTKDQEGVNVYCIKEDITVGDVLMGVAATIKMVIEETGKDEETVWEVVKKMIDETNNTKKRCEDDCITNKKEMV